MSGCKLINTFSRIAFALGALVCGAHAGAATYNLPGSLPASCMVMSAPPAPDPTEITCTNLNVQQNDIVTISGPTIITVTGNFNQAYNSKVNQGGSAANLTINVTGTVELGQDTATNASITSSSSVSLALRANVGGSVTATSNISMGQASQIGGNVVSTTGAVNANQQNVVVGGSVQAAQGVQFGQNSSVGGYIVSQNSNVSFHSGTVAGYIQALNGTVTTSGQNNVTTNIGGPITAKGQIQLGPRRVVNGSLTSLEGGIQTGEEVHVLGDVTAYGNINLGQDAVGHTTVTGNVQSYNGTVTTQLRVKILGYVIAHGSVTLGQQSNIGGNVTSNTGGVTTNFEVVIGGGVDSASNVVLGQATQVGQSVDSGAGVTLGYAVMIGGGIEAEGTVSIGQASVIDEDVESGGNVTTQFGVTIGGGIITTGDVQLGQNTTVGEFIQAEGSVTPNGSGVTVGGYINTPNLNMPPGNTITTPPGNPPLVVCNTDPEINTNLTSCPGWSDPNGPVGYQLLYTTPVLSCAPLSVTIRACANESCTETAQVSDSYSLSVSPAVISPVAGTLTGGLAYVALPLAMSGDYMLGLSIDSSPVTPDCSSPECKVVVDQAVFTWEIAPLQRAGVPFPDVTLSASGCEGSVDPDTVMDLSIFIDCVNPGTCSSDKTYFWLDGSATLQTSEQFGTGVFDMSNRLRFDDAGQVRLHAEATVNGAPIEGWSEPFVVRPDSIGFSFLGALSADTYAKAGETFSVELRALNAFGEVTPNFGREAPAEKLILSETVSVPAGSPGDVTNAGSFTFNGGANKFVNSTLAYSEAGYAAFIAQAASGDYLGSGDDLAETSAQLRFVPWAFTVNSSSVGDPNPVYCAAPDFSYMGKDLGMYLGFTAVNKQGERTYNYEGAQAVARARVYVTDTEDGHADLTSRIGTTPIAIDWTLGEGTASSMSVNFARDTAPDGPYEALQYAVAVEHREVVNDAALAALVLPTQPASGYQYATLPACVAGGTVCDAVAVDEPIRMLYGKLVLADTYGPEDSAAPVNLEVHYWNDATQQFSRHTADSCTAVDYDHLVMQGTLGASVKQGNGEINLDRGRSPVGALRWSAPLVEGSFTFSYTAPAWLKDENGDDPTARATFGRYRGHDRVLSWQVMPLPPE